MKPKKIIVNDLMQQGYVYYLSEPAGENFSAGIQTRADTEADACTGCFRRQVHDRLPGMSSQQTGLPMQSSAMSSTIPR